MLCPPPVLRIIRVVRHKSVHFVVAVSVPLLSVLLVVKLLEQNRRRFARRQRKSTESLTFFRARDIRSRINDEHDSAKPDCAALQV